MPRHRSPEAQAIRAEQQRARRTPEQEALIAEQDLADYEHEHELQRVARIEALRAPPAIPFDAEALIARLALPGEVDRVMQEGHARRRRDDGGSGPPKNLTPR